jgi:hypothetical protein
MKLTMQWTLSRNTVIIIFSNWSSQYFVTSESLNYNEIQQIILLFSRSRLTVAASFTYCVINFNCPIAVYIASQLCTVLYNLISPSSDSRALIQLTTHSINADDVECERTKQHKKLFRQWKKKRLKLKTTTTKYFAIQDADENLHAKSFRK